MALYIYTVYIFPQLFKPINVPINVSIKQKDIKAH